MLFLNSGYSWLDGVRALQLEEKQLSSFIPGLGGCFRYATFVGCKGDVATCSKLCEGSVGRKMKNLIKQLRYKWIVKSMQRSMNRVEPLKIIIGAGNTFQNGWISTDKEILDVTDAISWKYLLQDKKVVNVLAEHVIEHLTLNEVKSTFSNIYSYLSNNGCLRIAVPDGFNTDVDYINYVKPNGWGSGSDDHKILWDINSLTEMLEMTGYFVVPRQYFTEDGRFICESLESKNGEISRKDIDNRTSNDFWEGHATKNSMMYTSLIVDAYKKL